MTTQNETQNDDQLAGGNAANNWTPLLTSPPAAAQDTSLHRDETSELLDGNPLEPLVIQASVIAAAPLHGAVTRDLEKEAELRGHVPIYAGVSIICKVSIVLACIAGFVIAITVGVYFIVENSTPTNTTFQYYSTDDYFGDDYNYY